MSYAIGARVKLTRDVPVTADGRAAGLGAPGPLSLAGGLVGTVTGAGPASAGTTGTADALRASFEEQVRGARLDSFATALVDDLRQRVIAATGPGAGFAPGTGYRVRFDNGFILDGLDESALTPA
ncbi:hypothetical protein [Kitasatospora purpeofusca]|uniref:hypothetical protein n=1 Tax=Kitasatospora purpeofusca TaxID=67352 RepID=UPI0004C165F4|nr:hypothetical protein [Kitasatospora purpeofusca]